MSVSGKIETTANVATIIVAVLIVAFLAKTEFQPAVLARTSITNPVTAEITTGKTIDSHVLKVDWAKNHRTLVMAISTTCHYCKDSVPFYQKLQAAGGDVKMVAVLPQPVTEARQYLSGEGLHMDDVKQTQLNTLGVRGTPTLLLVNEHGVIVNFWAGRLQPDQEATVFEALGRKAGS